MNIIKTTTRDKKTLYQLTKGANVHRLQEAEGKDITVKNFILYEDVKSTGEVMRILAVEADTGEMVATNSPTFISEFDDICTISGDDPADMIGETVRVVAGMSKSGRKYFNCVWA